ncbi:aldose 1-epimerase family protein [Fulvivirga sediminis]|uniref:Aldose 1-epimerase family protein n=1 Tax=Fulvivirga sediminis TaxID=2803949 RepID=A0A937F8T0_9BACT|nr:aldose 1-epimerase family protein [Fulvivirga sediminis]MBL3656374.1 aldose 1-epimerase family protein [Fulvivirga sediminis]
MTYTLENNHLKISAKSQGAELTSIFNKTTGQEMLWEGNPDFWGRHAPILFPFVGKLNNNSFSFQGTEYPMSQHGFARDMDFELDQQSDSKIVFKLKSNADTRKKYPFSFELKLGHELQDETITHFYEIKNTGDDTMLYSIGGHPAYSIQGDFDTYELSFEKEEPELKRTHLHDGLLDQKKAFELKNEKILPLNYPLFAEDALVFESLNSNKISLINKGSKLLTMNFEDFPFFGIWTKPGAPFLCLEPWLGIADVKDFSGDLSEKKGIMKLEAGQVDHFKYEVSFY